MCITAACTAWFDRVAGDGAVQSSGFTLLTVAPTLLIAHGLQVPYTLNARGVWEECAPQLSDSDSDDAAETARVQVARAVPHNDTRVLLNAVLCHPHFSKAVRRAGVELPDGVPLVRKRDLTSDELHLHTRCTACLLRDMELDTPRQLCIMLLRRLHAAAQPHAPPRNAACSSRTSTPPTDHRRVKPRE